MNKLGIKRLAAAFGAAAMMFNSVCIPSSRADASVITITSADEFIGFLKGCTSDEYSKGRTFIINNDIDMSGKEFNGGGIFCGTLMGNGHVIKNITMDFREANGGLFSNVGPEGQVRDLNISGDFRQHTNSSDGISTENIVGDIIKNAGISGVSPASSTGITGAVAAVNAGLILNCSFEGTVSGQKTTGGIVGRNDDSGIIDTCANAALVSGFENTGGIAGENSGVIKNSRNAGKVNPEAEETTKETGGIAGLSTGVIEYSNNEGEVGCEGYGINAGGIAGKQNGAVLECKNTGAVGAKKNAGGIVGIFVPFTDADIITDDLKNEWQKQKDDLKSEADKLRDNLKKNAEELTDSFGKFNLGIPGIASGTSVDNVLNSLSNYLDSAARRKDDSSQSLSDNIDSLSGALESAINDRTLENQINESLSTLSGSIADVTSSMSEAMDRTAELSDDVDALSSNLTALANDTSALLSTLNENASGADSRLDRTVSGFEDVADSLSYALDRVDVDTRALDNAAKALLNLSETLDDVVNDLSDLGDDVSDEVLAPFRTLRREINKIISDINDRKQNAAELRKKLEELKEKLEQQIGALPTMRPLPTIAPRHTEKPLINIGRAISDKLFITAEAAEDDDDDLLSLDEIIDTERIREEMKKVVSVDVTLDRHVAGEYTDTALVKNCINTGEIRASENSGGISGNMGVEALRQRGDTLQLSDGKTVISDLAVKATIHSCINDGEIYAKERNAGGIVGSSNVGIIKSCLGAGEVCAENNGYAGGIGGSMNASILYSIGAARLSGENDLGGIAGKGNVIRESYSLASFEGNAERIGMIAGSVDGEVKNNCFISEEIGGIGGASYEVNAENIPFEEMKCTDKLPERMDMFFNDDWVSEADCFPQIKTLAQTDAAVIGLDIRALSAKYAETQFRVNFIIDGETVKSLKKDYNETLAEEEIPELKGADGRYPHWNRDTSEPIRRHTDFKAEYNDATMTIASDETPPILLIEGNFSDATTVEVDSAEITADFSGYIKGGAYSFKITPKKDGEGGFKLHILAGDEKACAIGVVNDGKPEVIECERDGSYLICQMDKPQSFVILSKPGGAVPVTIFIIIAAAAAAAFAVVFTVRKKRTKETPEQEL
ncbi:MAG: hypothetical protein Q4G33_07420 [bacterium]|nr:hypothetical protein [bacterium]